jgi:uncharacterized protein YfeS
MVRPIANSQQ